MKISELLNEITRPSTQKDADQILRNAGYARIGYGSFGAVYQKNDKTVVKTFTSFDTGYISFIKMVKTSNNNPHFPLFYGNPIKITKDYYAIKQENLKKYNGNSYPIRLYIDYLIHGKRLGYDSDFEEVEEIMEYNPRFAEACQMIADLVKSNPNFKNDISDSNIMKRGKTLVFIDPIATPPHTTDQFKFLPDVDRWDTTVKEKPFKMTPEWEKIFSEFEKAGLL
jgi:hypothetical protein